MCFGKNIGLNNMNWFAEIVIARSNILFPEMLDLGTELTIFKQTFSVILANETQI